MTLDVNCPLLESIRIIDCSFPSKIMVSLCLPKCLYLETDTQLLEHFAKVKLIRKITSSDDEDFANVKVLQCFPYLEELRVNSPLLAMSPTSVSIYVILICMKAFVCKHLKLGIFFLENSNPNFILINNADNFYYFFPLYEIYCFLNSYTLFIGSKLCGIIKLNGLNMITY